MLTHDLNYCDYISLCISVILEMSPQSSMDSLSKSTGFLEHIQCALSLGAYPMHMVVRGVTKWTS